MSWMNLRTYFYKEKYNYMMPVDAHMYNHFYRQKWVILKLLSAKNLSCLFFHLQ